MRLPPSVKNWISLAGATIAVIVLFMIVFLFAVTYFLGTQGAYLGLIIYILLPGVMIAGLLMIPLGMWIKVRRERREGEAAESGWPRIDLNDPHHRNAALIFTVGTIFLLFVSAIGSYEAFHYTESVQFCGTLCHTVMEPEHTAHQDSPHARVACVACHVGPGVDWYVRSKMSGLYQVYAVLANVYPRPIETPIKNLRPAQAVCEQCHWPEKFYAYTYRTHIHYLPDEENTRWDIGLTLKVGSPLAAVGFKEGIHWHINPHVQIEYDSDESREEIYEVRYTNQDTGEVKVYRSEGLSPEEDLPEESESRVMDCIDCHNRPSHRYLAPIDFVDEAMAEGVIPADLPWVKKVAVELCAEEHKTIEEAREYLREGMLSFYRENHPEILQEQEAKIEQAITGLQNVFSQNIFPWMNARWSVYPDHTEHMVFQGCFRCHTPGMTTESGETIRSECTLCHLISSQGKPGTMETAPISESLEFRHPEDIGEAWKDVACPECHTGLIP